MINIIRNNFGERFLKIIFGCNLVNGNCEVIEYMVRNHTEKEIFNFMFPFYYHPDFGLTWNFLSIRVVKCFQIIIDNFPNFFSLFPNFSIEFNGVDFAKFFNSNILLHKVNPEIIVRYFNVNFDSFEELKCALLKK